MPKVVFLAFAVLSVALGACTSAQKMNSGVVTTGAGFDVEKVSDAPGTVRSRAAYDDRYESRLELVKAETILNGVRALQKEGYDRVAWTGPYPATLSSGTKSLTGVVSNVRVYRGIEFLVRGWKPGEASPPNARPISTVLVELAPQAQQSFAGEDVESSEAILIHY